MRLACGTCPCLRRLILQYVLMPADQLVDVANEYKGQGLATVAISANSVKTHPQVLVLRVPACSAPEPVVTVCT